ncbi:MAG: DUF3575 domain-containing protein [Bacteroidales bacterium]|nr:DUF3575 domain-containing protein [Bacteroidales bacterium]
MMNLNTLFSKIAKMSLKPILVSLFIFVNLFFIRAQVADWRIYYRFDNATVDASYLSNSETLSALDAALSEGNFGAINIVSFSSPEGNFNYNANLSARRAESLRKHLVAKYPQLAGKVSVNPHAECWEDLRSKVEADNRLSSSAKRTILSVIDSDDEADAKEAALKALPVYQALYSNYFRQLRYAQIRLSSGSSAEGTTALGAETASGSTSNIVAKANSVHFPLRGDVLNAGFNGNAAGLQALANALEGRSADEIASINITSFASPEGPQAINDRYCVRRAAALRDYIINQYPALAGKISVHSAGEAWEDLRLAIESDPALSDASRSQILSIIISNSAADAKEAKLRSLPEWDHLFEEVFPSLRYARFDVEYREADNVVVPAEPADRPVAEPAEATETVAPADTVKAPADTAANVLPAEPVVAPADTAAPATSAIPAVAEYRPKKTIAAIKTNLLADAVTALNFEVEVPVGKRFSLMAEDTFPWWEKGNKYCFQLWEMGMEARYWLKPWQPDGTNKLQGWFGGIYGMSGKYDFQYDKAVNYQGEFWSAGITAGYAKTLGRKKWGTLEFSLGLGYLKSEYRHYYPADDYSQLYRDRAHDGKLGYFGPTKAKVSLVVPINIPIKKEVSHE